MLTEVAKKHPIFSKVAREALPGVIPDPLAKVLLLLVPAHLISVAILVILLLAWPVALYANWNFIPTALVGHNYGRALVVGLLLFSGFLLYLSRVYMRPVYGFIEIFIGCMSCWSALTYPSGTTLPATLSLVGGIYIIIRGFDNMIEEKFLTDPYK